MLNWNIELEIDDTKIAIIEIMDGYENPDSYECQVEIKKYLEGLN